MKELDELERLANAATGGPWEFEIRDGDAHIEAPSEGSIMCDMSYYPWTPDRETMKFIAAASPDVILSLIRELKITQRALEIAERSAPWRSAYLSKAIAELYPETEKP